MRKPMLLIAATAVALTPAAAQAPRYLNPRDVAEAQQQHAALIQEFGGAETGPRAAYVESIGRRVGAYSGVASPGQTLHFTTLNSAVSNAMSVPGGYVYITRQLLTLMDDESQLAFALGHEVGHIAANHAHIREQYANRTDILGVLGAIFGSMIGGELRQGRSTGTAHRMFAGGMLNLLVVLGAILVFFHTFGAIWCEPYRNGRGFDGTIFGTSRHHRGHLGRCFSVRVCAAGATISSGLTKDLGVVLQANAKPRRRGQGIDGRRLVV